MTVILEYFKHYWLILDGLKSTYQKLHALPLLPDVVHMVMILMQQFIDIIIA